MSQPTDNSGIHFSKRGDVNIIEVENAFAKATLSPFGATVLSYCPKDEDGNIQEDVLWVSDEAVYDGSKPIRGGIPICWPWFGPYNADFNAPLPDGATPGAHGFARRMSWRVEEVGSLGNGATQLIFGLESNEETFKLWPYHFSLELQVVIGETLSLSLTTHNPNELDLPLTEALHTYYRLPGDGALQIEGLQGSTRINTLEEKAQSVVEGDLGVNGLIDSVFLNVSNGILAKVDRQPALEINTSAASSCVVWNPGTEVVKGFADINNAHWSQFVCIENGNVWDNRVLVPSEGKHKMQVVISRP